MSSGLGSFLLVRRHNAYRRRLHFSVDERKLRQPSLQLGFGQSSSQRVVQRSALVHWEFKHYTILIPTKVTPVRTLGRVIDNARTKVYTGPTPPLLQSTHHGQEFQGFGIALQPVLQPPMFE